MANTILMSDNLVSNSTFSIGSGTQNAQFPLSNIAKDATTSVARVGAVQVPGDAIDLFSDTWTSNSFPSDIAQNNLVRPSAGFVFNTLASGLAAKFSIGHNALSGTNRSTDFDNLVTKLNAGTTLEVTFNDGTNQFTSQITAIENSANLGVGRIITINASSTLPNASLALSVAWTTTFAEVSLINGVRVNIEFQIDTDIDTVAVVGSNLDGLGYSSLNIKTSLTNDFSSAVAIPVALNSAENFGYEFYTSRLARHVQLEFLNTSSIVEISKVFIGTRITLPVTYSLQGFVKEVRRNDEITENAIGNRFVNILNARTYYTGLFPLMERDNFLILENIFLTHGSYKPLWVMLDQENNIFTNGEFKMSTYAYINNIFSHDLVGGGYYNVTLELLETV